MNINYKYTTIGLLILFIICLGYCFSMKHYNMSKSNTNNMQGMHMMPDGKMMKNDGTSMDMDHESMNSMMMDMVANMRGKSGTELERVFIADMIPHHQGAVDMAKLLLQDQSIKPELRTFAENIISAQESEITQMNEWLKNYK